MAQPSLLLALIEALRVLPGVGPKSAQRMAYQLLQKDRQGARTLGQTLLQALDTLTHCVQCNNFSETELCERCASEKRNRKQLCVVETPVDMNMIEQTQAYEGLYFILMGRVSPLDGVGAGHLALDRVVQRVIGSEIEEVILATNYTNEGEATAYYLSMLLQSHNVRVTRIARGVPVGGELEFVDGGTLAQALAERKVLSR